MIYTLAFYVFIASFLVQLYFWVIEFADVISHQAKTLPPLSGPGVSIVVCAKNEAENLNNLLPAILSQEYHPFEVIVVDDWSDDNTPHTLELFEKKSNRIHVCRPERDVPGKKHALTCGVTAARFEHILLTDADCLPSSKYWIAHMMEPFSKSADVVLGVAPYTLPDTFVSRFAFFDNLLIFLLYASATLRGYPYMGVGRNLAYKKHLYQDLSQDGFIGGDDDLFISSLRKASIFLQDHAYAQMVSNPPASLRSFLHQKRRHTSPSWRYGFFTKLRLTVFAASHWLFYSSFIYLLLTEQDLLTISVLWAYRCFLMIRTLQRSTANLPVRFLWRALFLDSIYLLYYPFLALFLVIKPTTRW